MKKLFLCLSIFSYVIGHTQKFDTLKDSSNAKVYKVVKIGQQVWMAENLNVSKFRNGDSIPQAKSNDEWVKAGENKNPAWCYYNNDLKNGEKYGKLYNWYAVNDPRGLAPIGWHIPSNDDWEKLAIELGGTSDDDYKFESAPNLSMTMVAGGKMKSAGTKYWQSPNHRATNESGFSALPGGLRMFTGLIEGSFTMIYVFGSWWTSSEYDSNSAWYRNLSYSSGALLKNTIIKGIGFSVRCLKN